MPHATFLMPLDYAQTSPWHQRRSSRRVVMLCFGVLLLGLCLRWGGSLVQRAKANYWFAQCVNHSSAPDEIAFEEDAAGSAVAGRQVPQWSSFYGTWSRAGLLTRGTLFLHKRMSRSGNGRLVGVDLLNGRNGGVQMQSRVFEPPVNPGPAKLKSATAREVELLKEPGGLRIFAGQADPSDASHFTIAYQVRERRGLIDGWLKDDDTVLLEPREESNLPATSPARPSTGSSR